MSEYLFDNRSEPERRRLDLLQQIFDPITREHLERIPLPPGAQCLDFGAGAGSVARWLCTRVGPAGRVVATDLDTVFPETLTEPNLEVGAGGLRLVHSGCSDPRALGDLVRRVHAALQAVFPAGTPELGRGLPLTFRAAGLAEVGADGRRPPV